MAAPLARRPAARTNMAAPARAHTVPVGQTSDMKEVVAAQKVNAPAATPCGCDAATRMRCATPQAAAPEAVKEAGKTRHLPACAIPVELSEAIKPGGKKVVRVLDHDILLARNLEGQLLAWDDECPHRSSSLYQGTLIGSEITCCYHGNTYNARGECVTQRAAAAKTYDVTETNGVIFVGSRGIDKADKFSTGRMIPFVKELAEPGFPFVVRRKDVVKNHPRLMYENTMSVEHLTGVHHIPVPARNVRKVDKSIDTPTTEFEQPFLPGNPLARLIGADHLVARINERPPYASFVELRAPFIELTREERSAKEKELGRKLDYEAKEHLRPSQAGEGKRGQIFMFTVPTNDKNLCELITIYRLNAVDFTWLGKNGFHDWVNRLTSNTFVQKEVLKAIVEDRDVIEMQKYREGEDLRAFNVAGRQRMRAIEASDRQNPKPSVIVFGATGATGAATVRELLDAGHRVTAFVRNPDAVKTKHVRLHVVKGDVFSAEDVGAAVQGHDAAFVALGATPGKKFTDVASRGTRVIVDAMKQAGVKRLVCVTSYGLGGTFDRLNFIEKGMYNLAMKDQLADKAIQEDIIRKSSLEHTILRPRMLSNKPARINRKDPTRDPLEAFGSAEGETIGQTVRRAAVARFATKALMDEKTYGQAISLSQK